MPVNANPLTNDIAQYLTLDGAKSLQGTTLISRLCDADAATIAEGDKSECRWVMFTCAAPQQLVTCGRIPRHRRGDSFGIASDRLRDIYHATPGQYPPTPRKSQEPALEREERRNTPAPSPLAREIAFDILHDLRGYVTEAARLDGAAQLAQVALDNYEGPTHSRACEGDASC